MLLKISINFHARFARKGPIHFPSYLIQRKIVIESSTNHFKYLNVILRLKQNSGRSVDQDITRQGVIETKTPPVSMQTLFKYCTSQLNQIPGVFKAGKTISAFSCTACSIGCILFFSFHLFFFIHDTPLE